MYEYKTIEQQLYSDALKYIERADAYAEEKKYGHCAGCLAKAAKKITRAQHISTLTSNEAIDAMLKAISATLTNSVAEVILSGGSFDKIDANGKVTPIGLSNLLVDKEK